MKIFTAFEHHELSKLQTSVIVEMWDKVMGSGSGKRKYIAEFNEQERRLISRYYKIFYRWHLVTGIPQLHKMRISTYELMKKACNFFGSF